MKVLVANRGEIACRVLRTLQEEGIASVAVCSEVDAEAPHVWLADEVVDLGEPRSYLDIPRIIAAAQKTGATAVHPGYGFLAENAAFARACSEAGLVFIGPSPEAINAFGDKREAGKLAREHAVPVIPGAATCDSAAEAEKAADEVGYPVLLKAAAGGGGKGMRRVHSAAEVAEAFASAQREAKSAFGDERLLVEKYIHPARHVEVQILADGEQAVAVGERECSLQRRYQKIIEESPSPGIDDAIRQRLFHSATTLMQAVGYSGAATVEFLVGPDGSHYFLEVNTRLQVEHPVTEMRFGLDLVQAQIAIAHGAAVPAILAPRGHAIEVRLNAEDAYGGFLPATGDVLLLRWPLCPGVRVDAGILEGGAISSNYDPLLAKMIAWGADRSKARARLVAALRETTVLGLMTNQAFLIEVLETEFFRRGETFTSTVESQTWQAPEIPAAARQAAEGAAGGLGSTAMEGSSRADRFSPWGRLGGFRMGQ